MSESCNSRHFSWLMKSCFPNNQQTHQPTPFTTITPTTPFSSLPDDLLLECLCRVPNSSLPLLSLVCRKWSFLLDSPSFHHLRSNHHLLNLTLFSISISNSTIFAASHRLAPDTSWKISSFSPTNHSIMETGCYYYSLFSHPRLASISRKIYIIGRKAMLQCDSWTVSDAPKKRYGCIGASADGVFYIIGGLKVGTAAEEAAEARPEGPHVYASSMDLYDVAARGWLRSRTVPAGGCVVAATSAGGNIYVLSSHAVELSFWRFNASRKCSRFGEWDRIMAPPLPEQVRLDSTVRFSFIGVGEKVVLVQVMGCIDDLLRRSGRLERGLKEGLVLVYDCATEEWCRGVDMTEVIRRAACVCVEC